jgi:hypothetical protein
MTNQKLQTAAHVFLAVLLTGFFTGCKCCRKQPCPGPIILIQPASQIAVQGNPMTLTVDAQNPSPHQGEPVEYQWYFAYAPIAGATSKTLTINNIQPVNAGRYFVIVSGIGSTKSCDADIVVNTPRVPPVGNGGTLTIGTSSFSSGGATCFPNPPWDKMFAITNGNFVGPTAPGNATQPFPNTFQNPTVTLSTCLPANTNVNGTPITTLETGIVIVRTTNPLGDKVCATNNCTGVSPRLTINQRAVTGSNKYKATVVYKSATKPAGLNSITVTWNYP